MNILDTAHKLALELIFEPTNDQVLFRYYFDYEIHTFYGVRWLANAFKKREQALALQNQNINRRAPMIIRRS